MIYDVNSHLFRPSSASSVELLRREKLKSKSQRIKDS
ncbi:Wound-induced basic protein [Bienertia sinuspersici]